MERIKILVIGPEKVGKTCVANYLSGFRETPTPEYRPTVACRILEYEAEGLNLNKTSTGAASARYSSVGSSKAAIELWDVSGSQRYKSCWPAIIPGTHGAIFVFNPDQKGQEKELELWHSTFITPNKIKDNCYLVFAHKSTPPSGGAGAPKGPKPKLTKGLAKIKLVETSLDFGSDNFRSEVDRLIENIIITRRETEENQILEAGSVVAPS